MSDTDMMRQAIAIARTAHAGQQDKLGRPFTEHLRRVAVRVEGDEAKTIAFLHDLLEKAPGWTAGRLAQEGFPAQVVDAVVAMTRTEGEDYFAFCRRAAANPHARPVKLADLEDNRQQAIDGGHDPERYQAALAMLGGETKN